MKHYSLFSLFFVAALVPSTLSIDDCFGGIDNAAYLDWVAGNGTSYTSAVCYNATSSDLTQGVAVHWRLDDDYIYLAVAARATGFLGFGLAEGGGMRGADLVIYETANPGKLRDAHVLDAFNPVDDVCQDWVFVASQDDDGFLIFEAYRPLDTTDSQDHKILNDAETVIPAQRIIAAWGETSTASYHGANNIARGSLRWYGGGDEHELVLSKLKDQADGSFFFQIPNHTISTNETDYKSFCFVWDPDLTSQGVPANGSIALIAAEMIVTEEARPYVHHLDVFATNVASNESRTCIESGYGYTVYSWAPGILPFVLPDNVGYGMGPASADGLQSFRIQIHYNNPDHVANVIDNGGLRVYYSLTPREHELGIFAMGDALSKLEGTPIPAGYSQYDFGCSPECSSFVLDEPVTVIQELFHMHVSGAAAVTYHIRNGEIVRQANVDYFDFDQAGTLGAEVIASHYIFGPFQLKLQHLSFNLS
jgi:hypothetical protein